MTPEFENNLKTKEFRYMQLATNIRHLQEHHQTTELILQKKIEEADTLYGELIDLYKTEEYKLR